MTSLINATMLSEHLELMTTGLRHLMGACKAAVNERNGQGAMILIPDPQGRVIHINWINRENIPDKDIREKVARCHPGDTSMMAIVVPHPNGGRSGYRISTMVRWANHSAGYVVVAEAHYPEPPITIEPTTKQTPKSVADPRYWFSDIG